MGETLFLAHRVPFPPDRGDKIRGYHILRHLAAARPVHLIAFADDPRDMDVADADGAMLASHRVLWRADNRKAAALRALASARPVSLAAFDTAQMRSAVADLLARRPVDTIYVFSGQMAQYLPDHVRARVVMDFVDVDSAKFAAYARTARQPMRWMLTREARLLSAFERKVAARADASLFVSEAEAAMFRRTGAPRVHAVENGIDTERFDPAADFAAVDGGGGPLVVFTGQMDYRPNVEAVAWFADAVLPRILARHPDVRFAIVGRQPTDAVRTLSRRPGIVVTGEVADVRGWLAAADVVVAPLLLARGVQNKVLEAMAMARPVVASSDAAEGIDHRGTIRIGRDAAGLANEVLALLDAPDQARRLGEAARAQVIARYGWEARLRPLDALVAGDTALRSAA